MPATNLKQQSISGFIWTGGSVAITSGLQLLQYIFLAHLLSPTDFGLMGLVTLVTVLGQGFLDFGLSNLVVQRQQMESRQISSFFWANLAGGFGFFLITLCLTPELAFFFHESQLNRLLPWATLIFIIVPFGQQFQSLHQKELRFQLLAHIEVMAILTGTISSIALALSGAGVFSLIAGTLSTAAIRSCMYCWTGWKKWHPSWHFRWRDFQDSWRFGLYQVGERSLGFVNSRMDQLVIGKFMEVEVLGYYSFAANLILQGVTLIANIANRVAFPVFAQIQKDCARLQNAYLRIFKSLGMITAPIFLTFVVMAPPLIPLLFGRHWIPSLMVLQILALTAWIRSITTPLFALMLACNQAKRIFIVNLTFLIGVPFAVLVGAQFGSIQSIAVAMLLMQILFLILQYPVFLRKLIGPCFWKYSPALMIPLSLSVFMAAAVWSTLHVLSPANLPVQFACSGLVACFSFILLTWIFDRSLYQETSQLLRGYFSTYLTRK